MLCSVTVYLSSKIDADQERVIIGYPYYRFIILGPGWKCRNSIMPDLRQAVEVLRRQLRLYHITIDIDFHS